MSNQRQREYCKVAYIIVLLTCLVCTTNIPSVNAVTPSSRNRVSSDPLHDDHTPPDIVFISPQDGQTLDYGPINIQYDAYDSSGIQSVILIADNEVRNITRAGSSYEWHPSRDGMITIQLNCTDKAMNLASITIIVRVIVRSELSPMLGPLLVIGLIGISGVIYRNKVMKDPKWREDPDDDLIIYLPLSYTIRSYLYRRKQKE